MLLAGVQPSRTHRQVVVREVNDASGLLNLMPFAGKLGIKLDQATPERVAGRLAWAADLCTSGGVLHGGALNCATRATDWSRR